MFGDNSFYLPNSIKIQQMRLLNSKHGLFELFDKFQINNLFTVPQNSIVINLDNITFGPDRYTILLNNTPNTLFQIIYYSILYYTYQRKYDENSRKINQNLIKYILNNEIKINYPALNLTQEEIKIYIIKFIYILTSAKNKRKLIIEEFNHLPQISIIMVALFQNIAGEKELKFQQNARRIQKNILKQLGINIDLLSSELFILNDQYQIEIRNFQTKCQFFIYQDTHQNIIKIKNQHFMAESAYFNQQLQNHSFGIEGGLMKKSKMKVGKKSTIKSVQWDGCSQGQVQQIIDNLNEENKFQLCHFLPLEGSKQMKQSSQYTNVESQDVDKSKIMNFNQIIQQSINNLHNNLPIQTAESTLYNDNSSNFNQTSIHLRQTRKKFHKHSLQMSLISTKTNPIIGMGTSHSVKCIKIQRSQQRQHRRVPTFILNRAKAKAERTQNPQIKSDPIIPCNSLKNLRITFSYKS